MYPMLRLRPCSLALLFLTIALHSPSAAQTSGGEFNGHLLIVGGGPRPDSLIERFIDLAGGPGVARIVVIPTASTTPEETGNDFAAILRENGAPDAFNLHLTREEALAGVGLDRLAHVTGVWFVGGSQRRITTAFKDTPIEEAFHRLLRDGAVIGGTSAGAAIQSGIMITGGQSGPAADGRPSNDSYITIERENIARELGFGFLDNAIIDQHFVRRQRNNRLISRVLENPHLIGAGIDESTGIQVNPDGTWEIFGASVVLVYDARGARTMEDGAEMLGGAALRFHVLPSGSVFDPATGEAHLPQGRR